PIVLRQKAQQSDASPVPSPDMQEALGCGACQSCPPHSVPAMIPKHLGISPEALVTSITGEHDFADLPRGTTNRKGREHRYIAKGLIVMIDQLVEDRQQIARGEMDFVVIRSQMFSDQTRVRRFV